MLDRQELMKPSTSKMSTKNTDTPTTGWLDSDDDDYSDDKQPLLNENTLKQQQQYLLKGKNLTLHFVILSLYILLFSNCVFTEQDDGLDELASIVSRQKNIAISISSEVDLQNGKYLMEEKNSFEKPGADVDFHSSTYLCEKLEIVVLT